MTTDPARRTELIERILDGAATPAEWDAMYTLADADPAIWQEIVELQRDQAALARLSAAAGDRAAMVSAPARSTAELARLNAAVPTVHMNAGEMSPLRRMPSWAGWAVAAVLFVVLATIMQTAQPNTPGAAGGSGINTAGINPAGIVPVSSAQEALDAYINLGRQEERVIEELPRRVLIETRPLPAGEGFEVIYIRQLVERAKVPELFKVDAPQGDGAQPNLVRFAPTQPGRM